MENNELNTPNFIIPQQDEQNHTSQNKTSKNHVFSNLDFASKETNLNIKIIGVGGAGCNIVNHLNSSINGINDLVTLYAFNTDAWSLKRLNGINNLFIIDKENLRGYGSCGNPDNAKQGIIHDSKAIQEELKGTDVLILVTGFGKGTGSGATPQLAKIATEMGILTLAVVGMPSITCEGKEAYNNAFESFEELKKYATSTTTICNERIVANNPGINFFDLYNKANNEFATITGQIINMIMKPSQMNIDFSDIRSFFLANKFFMLNHLVLANNHISQEEFNQIMANQVATNISDVNVTNSKSVIAKLMLCQTTSNDFMLSFKKACMYAVGNDNVKVVCGVDYSTSEKIEITYVIAATDEIVNLEKKIFDQIPKEIKKPEPQGSANKSQTLDEFAGLTEEINNALTPTKDLQKQKPNDSNENDIG